MVKQTTFSLATYRRVQEPRQGGTHSNLFNLHLDLQFIEKFLLLALLCDNVDKENFLAVVSLLISKVNVIYYFDA